MQKEVCNWILRLQAFLFEENPSKTAANAAEPSRPVKQLSRHILAALRYSTVNLTDRASQLRKGYAYTKLIENSIALRIGKPQLTRETAKRTDSLAELRAPHPRHLPKLIAVLTVIKAVRTFLYISANLR